MNLTNSEQEQAKPAVTAQHTPGPWKYSPAQYRHARHENFATAVSPAQVAVPMRQIKDGHVFDGVVLKVGQGAEAEANARLIAAAPDLLEELNRLEATALNLHCALQSTAQMDPNDRRISEITGGVVRDLLVMRDEARAAIAKATRS